jgi:hypothetical protein
MRGAFMTTLLRARGRPPPRSFEFPMDAASRKSLSILACVRPRRRRHEVKSSRPPNENPIHTREGPVAKTAVIASRIGRPELPRDHTVRV